MQDEEYSQMLIQQEAHVRRLEYRKHALVIAAVASL
jgi:hypothetical protein